MHVLRIWKGVCDLELNEVVINSPDAGVPDRRIPPSSQSVMTLMSTFKGTFCTHSCPVAVDSNVRERFPFSPLLESTFTVGEVLALT